MASCKTTQWSTGSPYVKLTVTESTSTSTSATLFWRLDYIATSAAVTSTEKAYTVALAGETIKSSTFDIDGKTGTHTIASGTKVITKTTTAKTISFSVSFSFNLTWSGTYKDTLTATGSISVPAVNVETIYTVCGVPSNLSIVDNGNNTATISCKIGSNGTNNIADGVDVFFTCDGTTPSSDNFNYKYSLSGTAGTTVSKVVSFTKLSKTTMSNLLGDSCIGSVKFTARTTGEAGSAYYSATATVKSSSFAWYDFMAPPQVLYPEATGEIIGLLNGYTVTWTAGTAGINNPISKYTVRVYNITTAKTVATYSTTNLSYTVPASVFVADNVYCFYITTVGTVSGFDSQEAQSCLLKVQTINKFSNLTITASDGNTIASTDFLGSKSYVDIGSGTVLKLSWNTPVATNNKVDHYSLYVYYLNTTSGSNVSLVGRDVGNINEFYVTSSMLSSVTQSKLDCGCYVVAHSKYGAAYNVVSNTISFTICRGCGTYIKVTEEYIQPTMKRATGFAKLDFLTLLDSGGKALSTTDDKVLNIKATSTQSSTTGWSLMRDFYSKNTAGSWQKSDLRYEILTDQNGEIITDINDSPVYTL